MSILADCSRSREFEIRNCLETPQEYMGVINLQDMKVHHFPYADEQLPISKRMQLEQCHDTARLAVTQ